MADITFTDVSVTGGSAGPAGLASRAILSEVSLRLTEKRVSIIGANGSGKSTFARLINGLRAPTNGIVSVDGLDLAKHGGQVRRRVGFVFSDPAAQTVMPTPIEDISLSLRYAGVQRAEREPRAMELLERFGLADHAQASVFTLSGGQRQLLALAAVLAVNPEIIVCDEPTTLLDLRNSMEIAAVLNDLPQQLIVVTHDLELAKAARRTIVLDDGKVVADGPSGAAIEWYRDLTDRRMAKPGSAS